MSLGAGHRAEGGDIAHDSVLRAAIHRARRFVRRVRFLGVRRFCNVCERSSRIFLPYGDPPVPDRSCPLCGSLERHRLQMAFLRSSELKAPVRDVLHVAPEPFMQPILRRLASGRYTTLDLLRPGVDIQCSLENIPLPDRSFDLLHCSSVLQFVRDDRSAIAEMHRILRPEGTAILSVPLFTAGNPYSEEHGTRRYDAGFEDLLKSAGFVVRKVSATEFMTPRQRVRMSIPEPDIHPLYVCRRPSLP